MRELPCVAPLKADSSQTLLVHEELSLHAVSAARRPRTESRVGREPAGARPHDGADSSRRTQRAVQASAEVHRRAPRRRIERVRVESRLRAGRTHRRIHVSDDASAEANGRPVAAGRRTHSRRLSSRQRVVARRRAALRRLRRHRHGTGGAGSVDAAFGRARGTDAIARRNCSKATRRFSSSTNANSRWSNHCARCESCTTRRGSRGVGTIRRFSGDFRRSAACGTGRSTCCTCANNLQRSTNRRWHRSRLRSKPR